MDRTERFYKINGLLHQHKVVSFATLQAALEVSPLRLVHYRDNWYLDAWCHLRQGLRNFALDAITEVQLLERPAREVSAAKLDATFGPSYGIFSGGSVRWARLRFSPERPRVPPRERR